MAKKSKNRGGKSGKAAKSKKPSKSKPKSKKSRSKSRSPLNSFSRSPLNSSRDRNKRNSKKEAPRQFLKMEDFEKPTVAKDFANYLRFSHCILDYQLKEKVLKENEYKGNFKKSKSKVFHRLNAKKKDSVENDATKESEGNNVLENINTSIRDLMKIPFKKFSNLILKRAKKDLKPTPVDLYFIKLLLPKLKKKKGSKKSKSSKNKTVCLTENLYLRKYDVASVKTEKSLMALDLDEYFYHEKLNFSPRTLKKEKGSDWTKLRIEKNLRPKMLFGLTKVNNIGSLLKNIENKISANLDKKNPDSKSRIGKKNFWEAFSQDKKYLRDYKTKHMRKVEEQVIGKKLKDKMKYADDFLIKRKANEFVEQINNQQNSTLFFPETLRLLQQTSADIK